MATRIGTIEGKITLRDEFTGKIKRATSQLEKSGKKMERTGRRMSEVGGTLTRSLSLPLVAIGGLAVKSFSDFDDAMKQSLAIMGDVSSALRDDMAGAARTVAKTTVFSAKEAAESYFFLASAGLDAAQSIEAMPQVAAFAQAGMFNMARATDLLTDAQSALGLTVDDTAENTRNMARVSDVLVKANTLANASVEQFSTALTSKAGAALKSFDIAMEEGVAVLAAFADQGVKAELAGNSLDRLLRLLPSAALKNADAYREMGIQVFDSSGELRNMADILGDLERALGGMGDEQKQAALEALGFSARIQGMIKPLLGTSDAIREYEKELRNAAGTTQEVADKQLESFKNQMGLVKDQLVDAGITLGSELAPIILDFSKNTLVPAIERLAKMAEGFGNLERSTQGVIVGAAALVAAFGPLLFVTGQLITAWGALATAAPVLASRIALVISPVGLLATALIGLGVAANEAINRWRRDSEAGIASIIASNNRARESIKKLREEMGKGILTRGTFEATIKQSARLGLEIQGVEEKLQSLNDEWAKRTKDGGFDAQGKFKSQKQLKDAIGETEEELRNLESELSVVDLELKRASKSGIELSGSLEDVEEGAGGAGDGLGDLPDILDDVSNSIADAIAENEALLDALIDSSEQYEILNTLLDAGIPLNKALTGAYDDQAKKLISLDKALEDLISNRERANDLAEESAKLERELNEAMQEALDVSASGELRDGGEVSVHPELDPGSLEQMNEDWRVANDQMSAEFEAIQKRAWENIQDIASDAIAEIIKTGKVDFESLFDSVLDIVAQMLAKMLVVWLVNLSKRVAAEQAAAAQAALAWAAVGGQSGGFVGGGGVGGGGMFSGGFWSGVGKFMQSGAGTALLIAAGVAAAVFLIKHFTKNKVNFGQEIGRVSISGGEIETSGLQTQSSLFVKTLRDFVEEFERVTGGFVARLPEIIVTIEQDMASFTEQAILNAFMGADFEGLSKVWDPFIEALKRKAFTSFDELLEFAEIFNELDRQAMDPVTRAIRDMQRELSELARKLAEAGISAAALGDATARGWQRIRDSITGTNKSARQLFDEQMKAFNAELERERKKQEAALATAEAEMAVAQAEVARLEAMIAAAQAAGVITEDMLARWTRLLHDAQKALNQATAAAQAAQTALDALPEPISPGEFRSGKGAQRRSEMESLRDLLDQMEFDRLLSGMTDLEAGLARLEREYQANLEKAHGNAELIAALTAEYAAQEEQLRRQIQLSAVETFQQFMGIGADPFSQLESGFDEAVTAIEEAGFGADRTALMIARLTDEYERQLDVLSRQEFVSIGDSLMGIVDRYFSGVEGFEDFRMRLEQTRFELELANLRARFEILKAEGTLAQAVLDQIQGVFDFIDENPIDWSEFVAPAAPRVQRAARGVNNALEEMARRLESAKEGIRDFLLSLQRGAFGGRSNEQMFNAALAQFQELAAQPNNIRALEDFPEVARNLLEIARERFGSTAKFQEILGMVEGTGIDFLGVSQVKEDTVIFDERFFEGQNTQIEVDRRGHASVAKAVSDGFGAMAAQEERSRVDILAELRELRESNDELSRRLAAIESRRRSDKAA